MEGDIQVQKPLELEGSIGHYRGDFLSKSSWAKGYEISGHPLRCLGRLKLIEEQVCEY